MSSIVHYLVSGLQLKVSFVRRSFQMVSDAATVGVGRTNSGGRYSSMNSPIDFEFAISI
jgi:hypothetical protein